MSKDNPPLLTAEMVEGFLRDAQRRIVTKGEAPAPYGDFFPTEVYRALRALASGKTECRPAGRVVGAAAPLPKEVADRLSAALRKSYDNHCLTTLEYGALQKFVNDAALTSAAPPPEKNLAVGQGSSPTQCGVPRSCEGSVPLTEEKP